jgi:hypothetical protein
MSIKCNEHNRPVVCNDYRAILFGAQLQNMLSFALRLRLRRSLRYNSPLASSAL